MAWVAKKGGWRGGAGVGFDRRYIYIYICTPLLVGFLGGAAMRRNPYDGHEQKWRVLREGWKKTPGNWRALCGIRNPENGRTCENVSRSTRTGKLTPSVCCPWVIVLIWRRFFCVCVFLFFVFPAPFRRYGYSHRWWAVSSETRLAPLETFFFLVRCLSRTPCTHRSSFRRQLGGCARGSVPLSPVYHCPNASVFYWFPPAFFSSLLSVKVF